MKEKLLFGFVIVGFLMVITKLFYIQLINPINSQYNTQDNMSIRKIYPERGKIYDRNMSPLVSNEPRFLLFAQPKLIKDKDKVAEQISKVTKVKESSLSAILHSDKVWVPLIRDLDIETRNKIKKMNIYGVGFDKLNKRYYPEASLSAHLLGFVGKNEEGESVGYFGVEGYYNRELSGLTGVIKLKSDSVGKSMFTDIKQIIKEQDGSDLVLTIDKTIQSSVKTNLMYAMKHYEPKQACGIVANPNTMEILAMVCLPDYSQVEYYKFSEKYFVNPAISTVYEPGSIFKPLIVAAALKEKAIKENTIVNEDGPVEVGGHLIRTWDNKYEGKITIARVLERSSNVGMVKIGRKLGRKKILEYLNKYRFGKKTGIDLDGEAAGKLKSKWYPIDYDTVTFGQGIGVTQIQIVRAFSTLINGGKLLKPYVVKSIITSDKKRDILPDINSEILNDKVDKIVKHYLYLVVDKGEVKQYKLDGYDIGGKTGTAQIPVNGKYDPNKTVASFIGFAPVDKPKFIMLITLFEPKASPWGAETAAPVFFKIAKDLLVYYEIPSK